MTRIVSIRRNLLGDLSIVIILLSGAIMAVTFLGAREVVRTLSGSLISQTINQTEVKLHQFFEPVIRELQVARVWGRNGVLKLNDPDALNTLLIPVMEQHPLISSLLIADSSGNEHMILHLPDRWVNRQTRRQQWNGKSRWWEWTNNASEPAVTWKALDYDPRTRPWYQGVLAKRSARQEPNPSLRDTDLHWTSPYTFFTTKDPGITASVPFNDGNGQEYVIGFDILLKDISTFTTSLKIGNNGKVVVLTNDNRIIGLPRDIRYDTEAKRKAALLRTPEELGVDLATDSAHAFASRPEGESGPLRFSSGGQAWWGEAKIFQLLAGSPLIIVVLIPEVELLGDIAQLRIWILAITLVVLAWALWRARVLARRFSSPIEALVIQSDRISRGDLDPTPPIESTISEVRRLADAQEKMRIGLQSLMKLESDLQLARQIQQRTFPKQLPVMKGLELDAWSEPAEETGGDTYDIIGYSVERSGGIVQLSPTQPSMAMLLLADATGHGVGPALSVTQVRAMLRMAVRGGSSLTTIACHLNDQLYSDLHAGRFVTAWLGELDAEQNTLRWFSAGQAPLLYFKASDQACTVIDANAPPFGVIEQMEISVADPVILEPGDIFAVFSDGVFDAKNAQNVAFGVTRVIDAITTHHRHSAHAIMTALRESVNVFCGTESAGDDRTAIIIKHSNS